MSFEYKVSVLVTFYNQEDCVDRAIGSILTQDTDFPIEVLIGDDGSSDQTWTIIQNWVMRFPDTVKAFRMSRDDGVIDSIARASHNRIFLSGKASGQYLVYLDGDDYFPDKSKLRVQAEILDVHQNCGSCVHNFEYVDADGERLSLPYPESIGYKVVSFDDFWSAAYYPASCFMFRKPFSQIVDTLDRDNFDDNIITYLFAHGAKVAYFGRVMFSYVQKEESIWNSMNSVSRVLANERDFAFEITAFPDDSSASSEARHSIEHLMLALFSRQGLREHEEYAERLGLFDYAYFSGIWCALTSEDIVKRTSCRLKLFLTSLSPALHKVKSRLALQRGGVRRCND